MGVGLELYDSTANDCHLSYDWLKLRHIPMMAKVAHCFGKDILTSIDLIRR